MLLEHYNMANQMISIMKLVQYCILTELKMMVTEK